MTSSNLAGTGYSLYESMFLLQCSLVTINGEYKIGKAINLYRVFDQICIKITTVAFVNIAVNQVNNMFKIV
jgi:hypothetical protein